MGRARQFAKNSFWLAVSAAAVVLIGAVYRIFIGRLLGPDGFGRYSFIQTFVGYFLILGIFGFRQVITREIGVDRSTAGAYLRSSHKLIAGTVLVAIAACMLIGVALRKPDEVTRGIYILSLSIVAVALGNLFEGVLVALQRTVCITIASVVGGLAKLALGIWALEAGYGLLGVLATFVLTSALTTVIEWLYVRSTIRREPQKPPTPGMSKYIMGESYPFVFMSASTLLYHKNDVFFLSLMRGDLVTGLYSAAYVFIDLLMTVRNSIVATANPMLARIYKSTDSGEGQLASTYERLHKHMILIFLPISMMLMVFTRQALTLVFGEQYVHPSSIQALQILVWMVPPQISCLISGTYLCATYRQRLNAVISAVAMGISVLMTAVLVYVMGAKGAAIATTVGAAMSAAIHYWFIRRLIGPSRMMVIWVKPLTCGLLMLASGLCIVHSVPGWEARPVMWLLTLVAMCAVYAVAMLLLKTYDAEDLRIFRSLLTQKLDRGAEPLDGCGGGV